MLVYKLQTALVLLFFKFFENANLFSVFIILFKFSFLIFMQMSSKFLSGLITILLLCLVVCMPSMLFTLESSFCLISAPFVSRISYVMYLRKKKQHNNIRQERIEEELWVRNEGYQ